MRLLSLGAQQSAKLWLGMGRWGQHQSQHRGLCRDPRYLTAARQWQLKRVQAQVHNNKGEVGTSVCGLCVQREGGKGGRAEAVVAKVDLQHSGSKSAAREVG